MRFPLILPPLRGRRRLLPASNSLALVLAVVLAALPVRAALVGHGGPVRGIAVSADGTRALTAGFDYSVILWDLAQQRPLARLLGHDAGVNAVAFLPGAARAVSASDDGTLILWDLARASIAARWRGHRGKVAALAVSPGGATVASGGWDHEVRVWDVASGASRVLSGHAGNVNAIAFAPDGALLATGGYDGEILLWRVGEGSPLATVPGNGFPINALAFTPSGRLVSASSDKTVRVWDVAQRRETLRFTAGDDPVVALALGGEGGLAASATSQGEIDLWRLADGEFRRSLYAARGPVWSLAFTPDGKVLLSSGLDGVVRLWDTADGHELSGAVPPVAAAEDDGDRGALLFRKCRVCHTLTPGDDRKAGPTLYGLFGRRAGSVAGYPYSLALRDSGLVWNEETVDKLFAEGPDVVAPGSKMPLQKIPERRDRAELIEFLKRSTMP